MIHDSTAHLISSITTQATENWDINGQNMKRNRKGKCQVVFRLHKACYSSKFKHIFSCVAVHNAVLSLLKLEFF